MRIEIARKSIFIIFIAFMSVVLIAHFSYSATTLTSGCALLPASVQSTIETQTPWYCPINQQMYLNWQSDLPIALVAVLISFAVASIIFMVGAATKNDKIRNFGVGELYEAIASTIIVGLFLYVSAVMFGLLPSIFVGPINPFATSFHFILVAIYSAQQLFASLYHVVMLDSYYSSINVAVTFPITGTALPNILKMVSTPLTIFIIEPAEVLSALISDGMVALYAEYYLLLVFAVAAMPVFLAPGVVLRAIFPTRALGSMLIALAFAFYFVVPALFSVAFYFTIPTMFRDISQVTTQISGFSNGASSIYNSISASSPIVLQLSNVESAMNGLWLMMLFYPFLIIGIAYAFAVEVARFLSGSAQMTGRLRGFI